MEKVPNTNNANKILVLAHRDELIRQAYHTIKSIHPFKVFYYDISVTRKNVAIDIGINKPNSTDEIIVARFSTWTNYFVKF